MLALTPRAADIGTLARHVRVVPDSLNQHGAVLGGQATVWPAPNRRSSRNVRSSAGVELGAG
jgi:hypothetical protein